MSQGCPKAEVDNAAAVSCGRATARRASVAVLCLSVLLPGCTPIRTWVANGFKVGPEYCPPIASLEVEWIDLQTESRLSADSPDISMWWHALNDPLLNTLIDQAYQQNLTLRQAGQRIQQAQAIRGVAVGNLFPQLQQVVGDYQKVKTSRNVAVPSPVQYLQEYDLGVNAAWELDFWGRFRRSVEAADAVLDASIWSYNDVAVILLADVASTYVEIRTVQQRLEITRQNLESQIGSLKVADARFQAQQTNKLDVNQAQNNVDITRAAIPPLEAQLRIANNRMCVLLGFPPADIVSDWPPAPIPDVSSFVQVGIPADLLRRRPDLQRSERLVKAQSERIGIAEAELYPHISIVGAFEWQAEDFSDLFVAESVFGLIGPSVSWNVLNYGRIRNSIFNEEAKFREAVYRYQNDVLRAQQEVEDAIVSFLKAQETTTQLADAVAQADEAVSIANTLYESGAIDFNRVYLLESVRLQQQDQLVVSRANVVQSLIQLYRALGGGWQVLGQNDRVGPPLPVPVDPPVEAVPTEPAADSDVPTAL